MLGGDGGVNNAHAKGASDVALVSGVNQGPIRCVTVGLMERGHVGLVSPRERSRADRPGRGEASAREPMRTERRMIDRSFHGHPFRIAVIAPPWFEIPPQSYGGIESVVYWLVRGLLERGHDVTTGRGRRRPHGRPFRADVRRAFLPPARRVVSRGLPRRPGGACPGRPRVRRRPRPQPGRPRSSRAGERFPPW